MRTRNESLKESEKRWNKERKEADRIMDRFFIPHPRSGFHIGLGWMPVVERAFEKMIAAGWDGDLHQVKQKFCGLRIYIGEGQVENVDNILKRSIRFLLGKVVYSKSVPDKVADLALALMSHRLFSYYRLTKIGEAIREAEQECNRICEDCGKEREKKGFGSGAALCDDCSWDGES